MRRAAPPQRAPGALMVTWALLGACGPPAPGARAEPAPPPPPPAQVATAGEPAPDGAPLPLGCHDVGVYSDLDDQVRLTLPEPLGGPVAGVWDRAHGTLVVTVDRWPVMVYPEGAGEAVTMGAHTLRLRAADARAARTLLDGRPLTALPAGERLWPGDRDADGIPDPLDVLVGAHKLVANGAHYTGAYYQIGYPGGDPPRDRGSCVDVVIRSFRNAGVDLQRELAEDIARAPSAYPMVKKPDTNIDHRRVRTLWPWFKRHAEARGADPRDPADPFRPGDVVFMDTIPGKPGPDHVGVVGDRRGESGFLVVINNWTDGAQDAEMDLLEWVPVVARYRLPPE